MHCRASQFFELRAALFAELQDELVRFLRVVNHEPRVQGVLDYMCCRGNLN